LLTLRVRPDHLRGSDLLDENVGDEDLIAAIVEHPRLLRRPIAVRGERAARAAGRARAPGRL
jgi:arsenate reductase-like glutaredoxin family protein